jgi:molecular chaperone DnaJ
MPILRESEFGDLYLEVITITPENISSEQKKLLEKFRDIEKTQQNSQIDNFIKKAKNFWSQ